jgi:electron transfer flavoprotein alpha subunit
MRVLGWSDDDDLCKQLRTAAKAAGAELFKLSRAKLPDEDPSTIAKGIAKVVHENDIATVLVGATKKGKDVAPRLAALLDWPYAAEIQSLERAGEGWRVSRTVLSGNSIATYELGANAVCTATPGAFEMDADVGGAELVPDGIEASVVRVTGTVGAAESDFDLGSADYVVGVGRGFKAKDDIRIAEAFAKALPGGAVGCSRPIAADLKWLGEEHWIGLSGHEIKPKVYFALGISGQIQHIAGIRGAKIIVAVNTNKDAPIFGVCDYGIVGDLYRVAPALTKALAK